MFRWDGSIDSFNVAAIHDSLNFGVHMNIMEKLRACTEMMVKPRATNDMNRDGFAMKQTIISGRWP